MIQIYEAYQRVSADATPESYFIGGEKGRRVQGRARTSKKEFFAGADSAFVSGVLKRLSILTRKSY
jgi:hypothetical protein